MLGNPADAEDLLQEIFLSAHRKLDGFRGDSALGTWLYRLATGCTVWRRITAWIT
jgi:RNA polymerase sigma-70 factor, ECF subfamily